MESCRLLKFLKSFQKIKIMDNTKVIVFTMKGCPFCTQMKDLLGEESIEFYERDIDDHKDEYDMFVKLTKSEYIPAIMIVEGKHKSYLYAPERDFKELTEAVTIIKKHKNLI